MEEIVDIFPLSEKEQEEFVKRKEVKTNEKNRTEYRLQEILGGIRHLKWEHGLLPMLGVKPLSLDEQVELNNLVVEVFERNMNSWNKNETYAGQSRWKEWITEEDCSERVQELVDRATHGFTEYLFQVGNEGSGALEYQCVRNGRIECPSEAIQLRRDLYNKSEELKEILLEDEFDEDKQYHAKYDKWGLLKKNAYKLCHDCGLIEGQLHSDINAVKNNREKEYYCQSCHNKILNMLNTECIQCGKKVKVCTCW